MSRRTRRQARSWDPQVPYFPSGQLVYFLSGARTCATGPSQRKHESPDKRHTICGGSRRSRVPRTSAVARLSSGYARAVTKEAVNSHRQPLLYLCGRGQRTGGVYISQTIAA